MPLPGQPVEDAELPLAQPLVDDHRHVETGRLEGDLGRLPGADVGRGPHDGRLLVRRLLRGPAAERRGLPPAELGQRHVDVAVGQVEPLEARGLGGVAGDVAGALAVAHDPQAGGPRRVRAGARQHGADPALARCGVTPRAQARPERRRYAERVRAFLTPRWLGAARAVRRRGAGAGPDRPVAVGQGRQRRPGLAALRLRRAVVAVRGLRRLPVGQARARRARPEPGRGPRGAPTRPCPRSCSGRRRRRPRTTTTSWRPTTATSPGWPSRAPGRR